MIVSSIPACRSRPTEEEHQDHSRAYHRLGGAGTSHLHLRSPQTGPVAGEASRMPRLSRAPAERAERKRIGPGRVSCDAQLLASPRKCKASAIWILNERHFTGLAS